MTSQQVDVVVQRVRVPRHGETMRLLVDRLWPRGVSKSVADLDGWPKEVTPTTELRQAVHSGQMSFDEFAVKYREQLAGSSALQELAAKTATAGSVALLIAGDPTKPNHAEILRQALLDAQGEV